MKLSSEIKLINITNIYCSKSEKPDCKRIACLVELLSTCAGEVKP